MKGALPCGGCLWVSRRGSHAAPAVRPHTILPYYSSHSGGDPGRDGKATLKELRALKKAGLAAKPNPEAEARSPRSLPPAHLKNESNKTLK